MSKKETEVLLEVVDIEETKEVRKNNEFAYLGSVLGVISLLLLNRAFFGIIVAIMGFLLAVHNEDKRSSVNKFAYSITMVGILTNLFVIFIYIYFLVAIR